MQAVRCGTTEENEVRSGKCAALCLTEASVSWSDRSLVTVALSASVVGLEFTQRWQVAGRRRRRLPWGRERDGPCASCSLALRSLPTLGDSPRAPLFR